MRALALALALAAAPGCGGASSQVAQEAIPDPLDTVTGEELFTRATALAEADDYVRAEQYFLAAQERGISEDRVIQPLVAVCVRSSRLGSALRYAEPYLERHPTVWPLRLLVATILIGLEEPQAARTHLVRIVEDEPSQPVPFYMLAVLHRDALGDAPGASEWFARYLALAPDGEHASEARSAIAHPFAREVRAEADVEPAPMVSATGAPARPVRMPSHEAVPADGTSGETSDVEDVAEAGQP